MLVVSVISSTLNNHGESYNKLVVRYKEHYLTETKKKGTNIDLLFETRSD